MWDILHWLIWMKFISILSIYVQFGTYRYFCWRIIAVLTQSPAVLMLVDITSAPKLSWKYVEIWLFVAVSEQWPPGKISGVHLIGDICVIIGSGNGLVPDGTKPLPEPVLTDIHLRTVALEKFKLPKNRMCATYKVTAKPSRDQCDWMIN